MNDWFNERYIKEIPIEEQIRGQVRAECRYMDKADIYEWIIQDEIKIMNLQSKIDKAIEYIDKHFQDDEGIVCKIISEYEAEINEDFVKELLNILKVEE